MLEMQADYVLGKLARMEREGLDRLEVRARRHGRLQRDAAGGHRGDRRLARGRQPLLPPRVAAGSSTQFPGNMAAFRTMLEAPDDDAYVGGAVREPVAAAG